MTRRPRQAFTLLEMIIVLALIATMLGVAAPNLRGMLHGRRLREECRRLLAVLHWAPVEAASSGDVLAMWFDPEHGEYGVVTADAAQETVCHYRLGDDITLTVDPPHAYSGESFVIIAWPDGSMTPDADCRITLTHAIRGEQVVIVYDSRQNLFALRDRP